MKLYKYSAYFVSEFICTALLVSCTCASRVALDDALLPMSICYGLINLVLKSCFTYTSGGYANPAVVLAMWWRGGINTTKLLVFMAGEIAGAAAGHFGFSKVFGKSSDDPLCLFEPKSGLPDRSILATEFLLTFLLVMTWCVLWDYESELPMEWYIGGANALIYLMGAYLTGAATNPARTLVHMFVVKKNPAAVRCISGQLLAGLAAPFLWGCLLYMVK